MQGQAAILCCSSPWAVTLHQFEGNIIFMCQSYGAGHWLPLYSYNNILKYIQTLIVVAYVHMNCGNWPYNCQFIPDHLQLTVHMTKHVPICALIAFLYVRIYNFNFILGAISWWGGSFVRNIWYVPRRCSQMYKVYLNMEIIRSTNTYFNPSLRCNSLATWAVALLEISDIFLEGVYTCINYIIICE